uniref:ferritin heavy chain, oocyte isoform-like n=1 Tax=Pristiophorus japonicus TaxID=55135 RepID=UPI00398E5D91
MHQDDLIALNIVSVPQKLASNKLRQIMKNPFGESRKLSFHSSERVKQRHTFRFEDVQGTQRYHKDCEAAVNKQINMELFSSYVYLSMSFYFDRDDVALCHFAVFFKEHSHEEREHAEKLMEFQNCRGGRIILSDIKKPEQDEWSNGLDALQRALQMEKNVNQSLLHLHKTSTGSTDPHLCDFLETHYLDEQVKMIKKLGDHITNLKRLGAPENGLGEYLFDKHILGRVTKLTDGIKLIVFCTCIYIIRLLSCRE